MAGATRDLTFYLLYTLGIATVGPLLFGYHLVCLAQPWYASIRLTLEPI